MLVLAVAGVLMLVGINQFTAYQRRADLHATEVSVAVLKQALPVFYLAKCQDIVEADKTATVSFTIPDSPDAPPNKYLKWFLDSGVLPLNWRGLIQTPLTEAYTVIFFRKPPPTPAYFNIITRPKDKTLSLETLTNYANSLGAGNTGEQQGFVFYWQVMLYQSSLDTPSGPLDAHLKWFRDTQEFQTEKFSCPQ